MRKVKRVPLMNDVFNQGKAVAAAHHQTLPEYLTNLIEARIEQPEGDVNRLVILIEPNVQAMANEPVPGGKAIYISDMSHRQAKIYSSMNDISIKDYLGLLIGQGLVTSTQAFGLLKEHALKNQESVCDYLTKIILQHHGLSRSKEAQF